jgi:hypothetical protein
MSKRIVKILMERDGISEQEAQELIDQARQDMCDCNYDCNECEDIIQDTLGLELDYLFDILL